MRWYKERKFLMVIGISLIIIVVIGGYYAYLGFSNTITKMNISPTPSENNEIAEITQIEHSTAWKQSVKIFKDTYIPLAYSPDEKPALKSVSILSKTESTGTLTVEAVISRKALNDKTVEDCYYGHWVKKGDIWVPGSDFEFQYANIIYKRA
jgi:hypothetical protein